MVVSSSPAKAGAQLPTGRLADAALDNLYLSNWAPAFAEGRVIV